MPAINVDNVLTLPTLPPVEGDQPVLALDLFIAAMGDAAARYGAVLARRFRLAGHSVEIAEGKLKRSMELANKLAARFTLLIGDNEMAEGRYALKNMASGEQEKLTADQVSEHLGGFPHLSDN